MTTVRLLHMHGQTHTHTHVYFFSLQNVKHFHTYMHRPDYQSANILLLSLPSIHPSIQANLPFISPPASPLPFIHTSQAYSKVTHLNYPGCAHTHSKNTHTHTHNMHNHRAGVRKGVREGGEIRKEGVSTDFTPP